MIYIVHCIVKKKKKGKKRRSPYCAVQNNNAPAEEKPFDGSHANRRYEYCTQLGVITATSNGLREKYRTTGNWMEIYIPLCGRCVGMMTGRIKGLIFFIISSLFYVPQLFVSYQTIAR